MRWLICLLWLFSTYSYSATDSIVTWNAREIFSNSDVVERKDDFKNLYQRLDPAVLLLQEITSCSNLYKIRELVGKDDYFVACTDFNPNNNEQYSSFELGIISKYPISDPIEYDPSPDHGQDGDASESRLYVSPHYGVADVSVGRGYLNARIDALKLILNVVHLKSSRGMVGTRDKNNAEKREFVIAAVADGIKDQKELFPDYTILVAGDFNVGHSDEEKNGSSLNLDCYSRCGNADLYDETHALLEGGLVPNVEMVNLTFSHKTSTYPRYPGSPIDNIYVQTEDLQNYSEAIIGQDTFGSDHLPVTILVDGGASLGLQPVVSSSTHVEIEDSGLTGSDLRAHLKRQWYDNKHKRLGYNEARIQMYSYIDVNEDGKVHGVYTGYSQPAKETTFLNPINAEHTVPQSYFGKQEPMKSDVHHLFPTHKRPNTRRGAMPFGETESATLWLGVDSSDQYIEVTTTPLNRIDSYSEYNESDLFEPPESHKGNVARAIAYFYTMYPNQAGGIKRVLHDGDLGILVKWHTLDPVDQTEIDRNKKINEIQGNSNPYIMDSSLLCKAWELSGCD